MQTNGRSSIQSISLKTIIGSSLCFCTLIFFSTCFAENTTYEYLCKKSSFLLHCEKIHQICQQAALVTIPSEDKPTLEEKQNLCSSGNLPYDPVKARKCAYLQVEQNRRDGPFEGIAVLMRVYANGEGVKRNLDLALKFACDDADGAPAEYEGRILSLNQLRQAGNQSRNFDYCDDVTSGEMAGWCASRDAGNKKNKRDSELAGLISSWSKDDKQEFERLRLVWKKYLEASVNEVDQSGTGRSAFVIEHAESLEENFVSSMGKFSHGEFPSYSKEDFIQVDRELNMIYKEIQGKTENQVSLWGTVTKDGIKNTQRAWLKFRDAWVIFAKQKYPSVADVVWKTWLTRERIEQLKEFSKTS